MLRQDYTVTVANPCLTATIPTVTFNPTTITTTTADIATAEFAKPVDSVDTAYSGASLCGALSYAITVDPVPETAWATIATAIPDADGKIELTIEAAKYDSSLAEDITKTVTVTVTFADWPVASGGPAGSTSTIEVTL